MGQYNRNHVLNVGLQCHIWGGQSARHQRQSVIPDVLVSVKVWIVKDGILARESHLGL